MLTNVISYKPRIVKKKKKKKKGRINLENYGEDLQEMLNLTEN